MKIFGIVLWLISGYFISLEINKHMRKKLEIAEAYIELIQYIRRNIECYTMPIPEILHKFLLEEQYSFKNTEKNFSSIDELFISNSEMLEEKGYKTIKSFCNAIGKGYIEGEIKLHVLYQWEGILIKKADLLHGNKREDCLGGNA